MTERHPTCNGTGETQTVNASTGDVQSNPCGGCTGGTVTPPQHGGNNKS